MCILFVSWTGNKSQTRSAVIAAISVFLLIIVAALGFAAYKKKNGKSLKDVVICIEDRS